MLFSNGSWAANVQQVSATLLTAYSYYPYLGNATLEPSIAQTITLGSYVLGSVNNATFVISSRSSGQPAAVVSQSSPVVVVVGLKFPPE